MKLYILMDTDGSLDFEEAYIDLDKAIKRARTLNLSFSRNCYSVVEIVSFDQFTVHKVIDPALEPLPAAVAPE